MRCLSDVGSSVSLAGGYYNHAVAAGTIDGSIAFTVISLFTSTRFDDEPFIVV